MDELLSIIVALFHWRLLLCLIGSIALAGTLSRFIPALTSEYCILLVIFGTAFGIYWQARAEAGLGITQKVEEPKKSRLGSFVVLALMGVVCGWFLAELFSSKLAGAFALVLSAAVVALFLRCVPKWLITLRSFAFAIAALLSGYFVAMVLPLWD
ncbi:MAG: hypothetical protein LBG78_09440 [Azoarcus sp.]|jgi:uncharacterized iron-regulated membrane protein|nr:hypothetical protein [Azoarcus sp.]